MLEIFPIKTNSNNNFNYQMKQLSYICLILLIISISIWYVIYSEPYKIYRSNKITPLQYTL